MEEEDLIPLSALQHYVYCARQCALIHIERLWAESRDTAEGRVLHERADKPLSERRKGVRVVTGMPLLHGGLGLVAIADVVEFHSSSSSEEERAVPVEYKRGRPKAHRADEVQLCAQALCLENMLGYTIPAGYLYYGKTHARYEVLFDDELRTLTVETARAVREMVSSGRTPPAEYLPKRCDTCSLIQLCEPRWLAKSGVVDDWIRSQIGD